MHNAQLHSKNVKRETYILYTYHIVYIDLHYTITSYNTHIPNLHIYTFIYIYGIGVKSGPHGAAASATC